VSELEIFLSRCLWEVLHYMICILFPQKSGKKEIVPTLTINTGRDRPGQKRWREGDRDNDSYEQRIADTSSTKSFRIFF
jgi:hypothetical protein